MIAPATRADLSRVGRSGARSRHGASLVYIDGVPHDKAVLAKRNGLHIDTITERAKVLRAEGRLTLANLVRPKRTRAKE